MKNDELEGILAILHLNHASERVIGEIWQAPYRCPCCGIMTEVKKVESATKVLRYGQCQQGSVMIRSYRDRITAAESLQEIKRTMEAWDLTYPGDMRIEILALANGEPSPWPDRKNR